MLHYTYQQICTLPLRHAVDVTNLEMQLRHLYKTDVTANCHALHIASYTVFRNECLRCIFRGGLGTVHAAMPDGYRLEYHDGNVMIRRLTFVVCFEDEATCG
jgi:hypothetical protein